MFVTIKPRKEMRNRDIQSVDFECVMSVLAGCMDSPTRIGIALTLAGCERAFKGMTPAREATGRRIVKAVKIYINQEAGKLVAIP